MGALALACASCAQIVGIGDWQASGGRSSSATTAQTSGGTTTGADVSTAAGTTTASVSSGGVTTSTAASTGSGSGCGAGAQPLNSAGRTGGTPAAATSYDMIRPPQPINPGDMLVTIVWVSVDVGIAPPSGWTEVASLANTGGGKSHWLWHRLDATDGGTFTFLSTGGAVVWRSQLSAYTGVGSIEFADAMATPAEPENAIEQSGSYDLPQVTTKCPNALLAHLASFSPDPGPITVSSSPEGQLLGYGNGTVGVVEAMPAPGTAPVVSLGAPSGVGDIGVGTFVLEP